MLDLGFHKKKQGMAVLIQFFEICRKPKRRSESTFIFFSIFVFPFFMVLNFSLLSLYPNFSFVSALYKSPLYVTHLLSNHQHLLSKPSYIKSLSALGIFSPNHRHLLDFQVIDIFKTILLLETSNIYKGIVLGSIIIYRTERV